MIDVRGLTVHYAAEPVLQELSLHVPEGQFLLVTGPSGCGKSTLARVLAGLIPHAITAQMEGDVSVDGLDTREYPVAQLARHVGIVLQNPGSQLFHLSVADEVAFGPRNLGLPETQVQKRLDWALSATGLADFRERNPSALSGGEQQRVAIASVLAMQPRVLVLDEPTASLDTEGTRMVLSTLQSLNRSLGMTIVLVEHRLAAALPLADRLLIMDEGRIVRQGTPDALLQDRELRRAFGLRRPQEQPATPWERLLTDEECSNGVQRNGQGPSPAQPLLSMTGVSAGYGDRRVLRDIDLALYPGQFTAVVGPNGAGKTTLALLAAGLLKPGQGRVSFHAGDDSGRRPRPGRDVTLLFQNPAEQLFTDAVDQEVAFGPHNYGRFDEAFHRRVLSQADLSGLRQRCPTHLSVGQQQRTALAACVALRPHLLILDEPTLGQDWAHLQQIMDFVLEMNQQGLAILLISHDYKLIYRYAQRVLLLEEGRLVLDGRPREASPLPEKEAEKCDFQLANW
ncbi:MAG: ABC transporter ATP-binding protein [bacterium]